MVEPGSSAQPERSLQAFDLELATLGRVASTRLRSAWATLDDAALAHARDSVCGSLAADRKHEPLFRKFPLGLPNNTEALWWTTAAIIVRRPPFRYASPSSASASTHARSVRHSPSMHWLG